MTDDFEVDPLSRVAAIGRRLAELGAEITELSAVRRELTHELHAAGLSHGKIAAGPGISRGRVFQILRRSCPPEWNEG